MRLGVGGGSRVLRGGVSVGRGGVRGGVGSGPFSISGGVNSSSGGDNAFWALIGLVLLCVALIATAFLVGFYTILALVLAPFWSVQLTLIYLTTALHPARAHTSEGVRRIAYRRAKFIFIIGVFMPLYAVLLLLMYYNLSNTPDSEGCSALGNFLNTDCYVVSEGVIEWIDMLVSLGTFSAVIIAISLLINILVRRLFSNRLVRINETQVAPWSVSLRKLRADLVVIYRQWRFHPRLPLLPDNWLVVPRWQGMPAETAKAPRKSQPDPKISKEKKVKQEKPRVSKKNREVSLMLEELNLFWHRELQMNDHKDLTEKKIRKYISRVVEVKRRTFLELQCDDAMALARFTESGNQAELETLSPRRYKRIFGDFSHGS